MDEEFIQLKWNTHQLAFFDTLSSLRDKQVYTDVTLSCGDQFYPAHRLVLSACSTFFARSLEVTSCKAPVVLLHGVDQPTLEQLLMFMYDGQVTISKMDLPKLLKAAHWLGVKGLDSAMSRHKTDDTSNEIESTTERSDSTNFLEIWRQLFSTSTGTIIQKEAIENIMYKQLASTIASENDQSSKSEPDLSETETMQEKEPEENTPLNSSTLTEPDNEIKNSYAFTQEMEKGNENSFHGWVKDDSFERYVQDMIEKPVAGVSTEANTTDCSDIPGEPTEMTKENNAADMNKRSLICKHCRKCFKVRKDLARHLRSHHDHTLHYCTTCHKQFSSKKEFNTHMKIHMGQKVHSCHMCEFVSHSIRGLKRHTLVQHGTSSNSNLSKMELVENFKPKSKPVEERSQNSVRPECSTCLKTFKNETVYQRHIDKGCQKIIRSKKGYHCPLCLYVSNRLRSVEDHLARHTGVYRFRCSYCPYQCVRNNILQYHMNKRHSEFI